MKPGTISLDLIEIASPCHVSWDEMNGDERARFCLHCKLNVYNLSEMSRDEAEAFLASREGRACVRLYRRADGTVLTRDCPVGVRYLRKRFTRAVAALASLFVALLSGTLFGGVLSRLGPGSAQSPSNAFANWIDPQPKFEFLLGSICLPPTQPAPWTGPSVTDPAETPLPPPTGEQLEQIQQRLEQ
jgi:hypothetical protein